MNSPLGKRKVRRRGLRVAGAVRSAEGCAGLGGEHTLDRRSMMRMLVAALGLALTFPAAVAAQVDSAGRMELGTQPVADSLLVWILNDAVRVPIEGAEESPYLIPRLYAISDEGGCVEDTHMICSHRYFLAVSEEGYGAAQAVFDLGEVGEIIRARVMVDRWPAHPQLKLTVQNFPDHAFQYNPSLVRQTRVYSVELDVQTLKIASEP
jgi:hypothetical protein